MIKKYGLILLFTLLSVTSFAQKDYTITISVNLEDCLNCNATIFDLRNYKEDFDMQIIMREEFQSDSTYIYKEYDFKDIVEEITFSDSLFNLHSPAASTRISVESKYNTGRFSMHIKETYDRGFFTYLENIKKEKSVLLEKYPEASRGAKELVINDKGYVAFNIPYKKTVYVYDFLSESLINEIQISEEIYKKNFSLNDDGIAEQDYDSMKTLFKDNKIPVSDNIETIFYKEDTLCFVIVSNYALPFINSLGKEDLRIKSTYGIVKYLDGDFLELNKFNIYLEDKSRNVEYSFGMGMHSYNNKLYTTMKTHIPIENAARFGLVEQEKNVYNLNFLSYNTSAAVYNKSNDFSILVFNKNVFALPIIGNLYNLENGKLLETLPFFKNTKEIHPVRSPEMLLFGNAITMSDDFVWVKIHDNINKKEVFYKMDRKTRKYELSSFSLPLKVNFIIQFDPINPDYIIYKDDKKNTLIREKIF